MNVCVFCVSTPLCGSPSFQCCLYETVSKARSVCMWTLKRRVQTKLKAPSVLHLDFSVPLDVCMRLCGCSNRGFSLYFPWLRTFCKNVPHLLCWCVGGRTIPSWLKDVPCANHLVSLPMIRWQSERVSAIWEPISTPLGPGDLCHGCLWDDCLDEGSTWLDDSVLLKNKKQNEWWISRLETSM